jgi:hypothetical protein
MINDVASHSHKIQNEIIIFEFLKKIIEHKNKKTLREETQDAAPWTPRKSEWRGVRRT